MYVILNLSIHSLIEKRYIMNEMILKEEQIENLIYEVRGMQVMLDSDLSRLYNVETKQLNRQVKRNIDRFDEDFMFQLTNLEYKN